MQTQTVTYKQDQVWLALRFPSLPREVQGLQQNTAEDSGFERNERLEQLALQQLSQCCYHFSPYVELQTRTSEPGLLLELSRCLKLFKGLEALSKGLFKQLQNIGFHFEFGLAHTAAGAWLLSWQQHPVSNKDTRMHFLKRLQATPIYLLQSNSKVIDALDKTGFNTLGDVIKQIQLSSLGALRKRYGNEFNRYLQDVLAIESKQQQQSLFCKPLRQYQQKILFCEHLQLDYPLDSTQLLTPVLEKLLQKLQTFLNKHQLQSQSIVWRLFDIHQNSEEIKVNTCQVHKQGDKASWTLFFELSLIQFEGRPFSFAVDTVELICEQLEELKASSGLLAFKGKSQNNNEALQITLAKVRARLGDDAIYKVSYKAHHIPEKSLEKIGLDKKANSKLAAEQMIAQRPCWLLKQAQKVRVNKHKLYWQGSLELVDGPERIEGYWWEEYCARDYFIAQREDKLKLWVYQDLQTQQWYTHGIFS